MPKPVAPPLPSSTLKQQILAWAQSEPAATLFNAKLFLHLAPRPVIDQTLSRLAKSRAILRLTPGLYYLPVPGRFGSYSPTSALIQNLAIFTSETIVPHPARVANALGLTTQVPLRQIFLTSGPTRKLILEGIELRHAPSWQLLLPDTMAGMILRSLAYSGPRPAPKALQQLSPHLTPEVVKSLLGARSQCPTWVAALLSTLVSR